MYHRRRCFELENTKWDTSVDHTMSQIYNLPGVKEQEKIFLRLFKRSI